MNVSELLVAQSLFESSPYEIIYEIAESSEDFLKVFLNGRLLLTSYREYVVSGNKILITCPCALKSNIRVVSNTPWLVSFTFMPDERHGRPTGPTGPTGSPGAYSFIRPSFFVSNSLLK